MRSSRHYTPLLLSPVEGMGPYGNFWEPKGLSRAHSALYSIEQTYKNSNEKIDKIAATPLI